jgi:uncharacterized membrane protein
VSADAGGSRAVGGQSRLLTLAPIVVFDIAGPLALFYWLSGNGFSTVDALILSGLLPACSIGVNVVRHRRLDAIGALVLMGIVVGTVAGLLSGSAHVVLLDGIIPTAVFGFVCLGSLRSSRPLMFRFAVETMGADTTSGRAFADKWRYAEFRRAFQITTVVWGLAFLAEAVMQLVIIQVASADVAKTSSNILPLIVIGLVVVWNIAYGKRGQRRGQRAEAAARAHGDVPPEMPA